MGRFGIAGTPRGGSFDRVACNAYLRLMSLMDTAAEQDAEAILAVLEYLRAMSSDSQSADFMRDLDQYFSAPPTTLVLSPTKRSLLR